MADENTLQAELQRTLDHEEIRFRDIIAALEGVASKSTILRYRCGSQPMNDAVDQEVRRRLSALVKRANKATADKAEASD